MREPERCVVETGGFGLIAEAHMAASGRILPNVPASHSGRNRTLKLIYVKLPYLSLRASLAAATIC
jgi:hypothetical protein